MVDTGVTTMGVIPDFDKLADSPSGFGPDLEPLPVEAFALPGGDPACPTGGGLSGLP
jgi:hypothetical protein